MSTLRHRLHSAGSATYQTLLGGAFGIVINVGAGGVYAGVPALVTVTATGEIDRVVLTEVDASEAWDDSSAPFSGDWTPSASGTRTLHADGYVGEELVATDDLEVEVGTYDAYLAVRFAVIGGGADALYFAHAGAEYMTLSGSDATQWNDLTGNGDHATDGTDRPAFVDPGEGADPYLEFTGANNDHMLIPYAQADGAERYTVALSARSTAAASACLWQLYNGLRLHAASGHLYVYYGSTLGAVTYGFPLNVDHLIVLVYDGTQVLPYRRLRVWIDGSEWCINYDINWPATLPATHSAGRLGNQSTDAADLTGRMHLVASWYDTALTDEQVLEVFALAQDNILSYADAWVPTGTALVQHVNAAPSVGADLALSATGYTITPGAPVIVYDKGAAHVGFTSLIASDGTIYCVFRSGADHQESTGQIVACTSTDSGDTWSEPQTIVDTADTDDRDPRVVDEDGTLVLYWVQYITGGYQLFRTPLTGGDVTNVFGYPVSTAAQHATSQASVVDNGAIVLSYSSGSFNWMCTRIGGTDVYWTAAPGGVPLYEPGVIRLASGDLLCWVRTNGAPLQMRSTDGIVWGSAQPLPATFGGVSTGIVSPYLFQMSSGLVLAIGCRRAVAGLPIVLHYSDDDGATWSEPQTIVDTDADAGEGGYCGVIELDSTTILLSYYTDSAAEHRIYAIPVTIEVTP